MYTKYMEKDVDSSYPNSINEEIEIINDADTEQWYDENGNPISEEEALSEVITDKAENVLFKYIHRNNSVATIYCEGKGDEVLPIRVVTNDEYRSMRKISTAINTAYCVLYPIEIIAVLVLYFKKKIK